MPITLPAGLRSARQLCRSAAARALAAESALTVSAWADQHRQLSSKASGEPGRWQTSRTPYLREMMDALSVTHPCKDGAFQKGTQIGGSEAMYNAIGYLAHKVPCPVMLVMPTTDTAKKVSKQRLQPMIDETPALAERFAESKSRSGSNTLLLKEYPGGMLAIVGANSGPGLRSMPMRVVLQDEIDAYPDDVDGEGDPVSVADKRADQFSARSKKFKCSTPKIKGASRIEQRFLAGTQGRYYVPCPSCRHEQVLRWPQMRWTLVSRRELVCVECGGITELEAERDRAACQHCGHEAECTAENTRRSDTDEVERAWYECEACGAEIDEHHKTWMLERGRFIHAQPGSGEVLADDDPDPFAIWAWVRGRVVRFLPRYVRPMSWHVSALYSPLGWKSWFDCVAEWIAANLGGYDEDSGESLLQVFYNTVLGEPFEVVGEQPKVNLLKQRVDAYALGQVPAGGLLLAAAADVQGDRLEVKVKAYGEGEESWTVDYQVLHGDPTRHGPGSVWEALEQVREKAYPHAGGATLRIAAMAVDSGYATHDVYDHCRRWAHRHVFAIKGDEGQGKPILSRPAWVDVSHRGKKIKKGVQLWHVGTWPAKERVYKRLELTEPGPGYLHFPRGLPDEYFEQLTAEKLVRRAGRGGEKHQWVKTRERNEALDLEVYCYAAAIYAGLQRINWAQLRQIINPEQRDLFAPGASKDTSREEAAAAVPPAAAAPASVEAGADAAHDAEGPAQTSAPIVRPRPPRANWVTNWRP